MAGQRFRLEPETLVGRSPEAAILIGDPGVSRKHARFVQGAGGEVFVEDLNSKNGTYVNGTRVERHRLAFGDRVRFGPNVVAELASFDAARAKTVQRQRFETVGRLAVGVAHDLNNVFAALDASAGFLEMLPPDRTLGDPEVRECIHDLCLSATQGAELTKGILAFARGQDLRGTVEVARIVGEVVRVLRHTIESRIRIESRVLPGLIVHGSHAELFQVVLNLCLNARDAMPEGGILSVRAQAVDDGTPEKRIELTVTDTGIGMDEQTQARVFEPFYTTKGDGFGIGLATVRDIVQRHGGQIEVESTPGVGTTFRVLLPFAPMAAVESSTADRLAALELLAPIHVSVLLVDGDGIVRRSIARRLRQLGLDCVEAGSGPEAVTRYARERHDLVVLDLDMSGMDGEQTHAALLALDPRVRVVGVSGRGDPQRDALFRSRGGLGLLHKPYGTDQLLAILQQVFGSEALVADELTHPSIMSE